MTLKAWSSCLHLYLVLLSLKHQGKGEWWPLPVNSSICELEARRWHQGQAWLHSEYEASLGYRRLCLKRGWGTGDSMLGRQNHPQSTSCYSSVDDWLIDWLIFQDFFPYGFYLALEQMRLTGIQLVNILIHPALKRSQRLSAVLRFHGCHR